MTERIDSDGLSNEANECTYCGSQEHDTMDCPSLHERRNDLDDSGGRDKPVTPQQSTQLWMDSLNAEMALKERKDGMSPEAYEAELAQIQERQKGMKALDDMVARGVNIHVGWPELDHRRFMRFKDDDFPNLEVNENRFIGQKSIGFSLEDAYIEGFPLDEAMGCRVKDCVLIGVHTCSKVSDGTFEHCYIEGIHVLSGSVRMEVSDSKLIGLHALRGSQKIRLDKSYVEGKWSLNDVSDSLIMNTSINSDGIKDLKNNIFINCTIKGDDWEIKPEDRARIYENNLVLDGVPAEMLQKCDYLNDPDIELAEKIKRLREQFGVFILR